MCINPSLSGEPSQEVKFEAAKAVLARLFKEKLDVDIPADDLGEFIVKHWRSVSSLSHIIHDKANPQSTLEQLLAAKHPAGQYQA